LACNGRCDDVFELFDFEKELLPPDYAQKISGKQAKYFKAYDAAAPPPVWQEWPCKPRPSDDEWPTENAWGQLNITIGGALLRGVPAASVCYNGSDFDDFAASACGSVSQKWSNGIVRLVGAVVWSRNLANTDRMQNGSPGGGCVSNGGGVDVPTA